MNSAIVLILATVFFQNGGNGTKLFFTDQGITQIPSFATLEKKYITTIFLNRNQISTITEAAFDGFISLELLEFSRNKIPTIAPANFLSSNLSSLKTLILSDNEITKLHNTSFMGLSALTTLDLSYNELIDIDEGCFQELRSLEYLYLSHNGLSTRVFQQLGQLTALTFLSLRQNKLQHIPGTAFTNLPSLAILAVDRNEISAISLGPAALNRTELKMKENPLQCSNLTCVCSENYTLTRNEVMFNFSCASVLPSIMTTDTTSTTTSFITTATTTSFRTTSTTSSTSTSYSSDMGSCLQQCVDLDMNTDMSRDCELSVDEYNDPLWECQSWSDTQCIIESARCDGTTDCLDGSDEDYVLCFIYLSARNESNRTRDSSEETCSPASFQTTDLIIIVVAALVCALMAAAVVFIVSYCKCDKNIPACDICCGQLEKCCYTACTPCLKCCHETDVFCGKCLNKCNLCLAKICPPKPPEEEIIRDVVATQPSGEGPEQLYFERMETTFVNDAGEVVRGELPINLGTMEPIQLTVEGMDPRGHEATTI
eukprot:m.29970 g.29970  ORF g.29970 m.29970 type:complete len:542 (-) comp8156_c0_seq1:145-1770(-)